MMQQSEKEKYQINNNDATIRNTRYFIDLLVCKSATIQTN